MKKIFKTSVIVCMYCMFFFTGITAFSQINLQCEDRDMHSLYLMDFNLVYRMDSVDTSPTNPIFLTSLPVTGGGGISINNNLDSSAGPVTMYFIAGGYPYYFWNGSGWTNTGNTCGSNGTINIGGTTRHIFNFDDNEQYVYRYDSTGNCTLLLTNIVSHGGVIHDVATDREGNFYLFFTNDQIIRAYDPSGIPVDSFTTTGFPAGPNCGFTILGDRLYGLTCNGADGLYEGIKSGNNIAFTLIKTLTGAFGYYMDLASCPSAAKPIAVFETPGKPDFIIYPNPARERATIKFDNTITLEISNNLGVLLETISVRGLSEYHLDVSKWKEGVYFVNAMSSNNLSTRAAFVIQHP